MLGPAQHVRPATCEEGVHALSASTDDVCYAGGTELVPAMQMGLVRPTRLVDLKGIDALQHVSAEGSVVRIGAGATHQRVADDPIIGKGLPVLAQVARRIGNPRVRAQGTVGGNLCFAEPRSDLLPTLLALDAELELLTIQGATRRPLADMLLGPYALDLEPGQLLTAVRVDGKAILHQRYAKFQVLERPTAGVALIGRGGAWTVGVGSAGHETLTERFATLDDVDATGVADAIDPVEDLTGKADYKRHLVRELLNGLVDQARLQDVTR